VVSHGSDRQHPGASVRLRDAASGSPTRAQATREAARSLVKQTGQLNDRADVLLREAEAALYALRDTMRQPPARSGTRHPERRASA
jgi:hypothetical protein